MNMLLMNSGSPPLVKGEFTSGRISLSMGFARSSSGTRINNIGILESAGLDEARFDWDRGDRDLLGLLYEPQRTNRLIHSRRISLWNNNSATSVADNVYASPDGTQNASEIIADNYKGRFIYVSGLNSSTNYAVSGYVKSFSGTETIQIGTETAAGTSGTGTIAMNTTTGSYSKGSNVHDASTTLLPNGWIYFKYRITTGASQTSTAFVAYSLSGAAIFSVWGCQVEEGYQASSLIQTNGASVTRAADQLSMIIPNGVDTLRFVFDDNSTQDVAVSAGTYIVPTNLDHTHIKQLYSL